MSRIAGLLACLLLLLLPPDPAAAAGDRALYWAISRDGEAADLLSDTSIETGRTLADTLHLINRLRVSLREPGPGTDDEG